jgi:hypothetical protein
MELAGWLAQQHAQELKEVLRLPGDRASQARTQLQALAQALHNTLSNDSSTSTSTDDGEGRGSHGAMAMEEEGEERSMEEVRCGVVRIVRQHCHIRQVTTKCPLTRGCMWWHGRRRPGWGGFGVG